MYVYTSNMSIIMYVCMYARPSFFQKVNEWETIQNIFFFVYTSCRLYLLFIFDSTTRCIYIVFVVYKQVVYIYSRDKYETTKIYAVGKSIVQTHKSEFIVIKNKFSALKFLLFS